MTTQSLGPPPTSGAAVTSPRNGGTLANRLRVGFVLASIPTLILTGGFFAGLPWATTLWPWPASALSYVFIGSILAAIAIPLLWIALAGEAAAIRAGALDLVAMYGGMFVYSVTLLGERGEPRLWPYAIVFALACTASGGAFAATRRIAWVDSRPMPATVRVSFVAFAVILVAVAAALIAHADVFPWRLGRETSVMFGCVYIGAAVYFMCGFLEPRWSNAAGQLAGFLVYDLILLAPFFDHFKAVHGGHLVSLVIYVVLLLYSAVLGTCYLFLAPASRIRLFLSA